MEAGLEPATSQSLEAISFYGTDLGVLWTLLESNRQPSGYEPDALTD